MKIAQIRDTIRAAMWTRNDLTGGTREEFRNQAVGPRLEAKIAELRALVIAPRFAADIARRDEEIGYCEAVIARWQAAQTPPAPSAPTAEVSAERCLRVAREWSMIAAEAVRVEYVKGTFYGYGSELAVYRIERKYNMRPKCEAFYSENLKTWVVRLETVL